MNFSQLDFGVFSFKIYGFFVAIAFFVASWHFYKEVQKRNLSVDFFVHHFWKWVISAIVVGRIVTILTNLNIISHSGVFSFFTFWDGGISFWGIIFGFLSVAIFNLKIHKESIAKWGDAISLSILIGFLILDVAGFFTGAIYGRETSLFWGIRYETFEVDLLKPIHPVTLYAAIAHLWIFQRIKRKMNIWERKPGKIFLYTMFLIFMIDFFLQFFRGDPSLEFFGFLRLDAVFDLVVMVAILFFMKKNKFFEK
jgi:phosphatidylglycerol:prolipoprotein diacylglycerol transferase